MQKNENLRKFTKIKNKKKFKDFTISQSCNVSLESARESNQGEFEIYSVRVPGQGTHEKSAEQHSQRNCLVCFDKTPDTVFMNCGYSGICFEWATCIQQTSGECYLCRSKIIQILKIDLQSKNDKFYRVIDAKTTQN